MADLGTLTIKIAADVAQLREAFDKSQAEMKKMAASTTTLGQDFKKAASAMFGAFEGLPGVVARSAEKLNKIGESVNRIFSSEATASARKFGEAISSFTGLDGETFMRLGEGLRTVSASMTAVAAIAGAISLPVLAGAAAIGIAVLAWRKYGDSAKEAIGSVRDSFTASVRQMVEGWQNFSIIIIRAMQNAANNAIMAVREIVKAYQSVGLLKGVNVDKYAGGAINTVNRYANAGVQAVGEMPGNIASGVASGAGAVKSAIGGGLSWIGDEFRAMAKELADSLGPSKDAFKRAKADSDDIAKAAAALKRAYEEASKTAAASVQSDIAAARARMGDLRGGRINQVGAPEQFETPEQTARREAAEKRSGIGGMIFSQTAGKVGGAGGNTINGAMQGFSASGNPWGAIIGAVVGLLTSTQGFAKVIKSVESVFESLAQAINPLMEGIAPVFRALALAFAGLGPVLKVVVDSTTFVGGGFQLLFNAMKGIGFVILGAAWVFGQVQNKIVQASQWMLRQVAEIVSYVSDSAANYVRGVADKLGNMTVDIPALEKSMRDLRDAKMEEVVATYDATNAINAFAESFLNLPSGYKVAGAQFAAAAAGSIGYVPPSVPTSQVINITVNSNAADAADVASEVIDAMAAAEVNATGQTTSSTTYKPPAGSSPSSKQER